MMRYATVDEGVDPRKQLVFIVLHGVFNILGAVGFLGLFILSVISQRLRKNVVLLSFFAVFPLVNVANTLLLWTGYIFKPVPFGLCVASGALGSSSSLLQVAAALALVLKVWSHTLMGVWPRSTALRLLSSSSILALIPWVVSLPFLIAGAVIASRDYNMVSRASPLYCSLKTDTLNFVFLVFNALLEIAAIVLAIWTGIIIARTRKRARSARTNHSAHSNIYYALTVRTLVFSMLLALACVSAIISALTSFSNPIPDVIIAIITFIAVPVFGSDPNILRLLFPSFNWGSSTRSGTTPTVSISLSQQTHVQRDVISTVDLAHHDNWKSGVTQTDSYGLVTTLGKDDGGDAFAPNMKHVL